MKGIKCLIAAALAIIATGCAKEQTTSGIEDGQEVTVSYSIAAPQGLVTKAISDGQSAKNLTVAVYDSEKNHIAALDQTATFTDLKATVEFHLVKGKTYNFIFWAQSETTAYTLDKDNKVVNISYEGVANDESRDAFFATRELKVTGALSETVELYRPFAQVNFGTADFEAAKTAGVEPTKSSLTATEAATVLDLFGREGKVSNDSEGDIAYTEEVFPTEELVLSDGTTCKYLSMNYFIPVGSLDEQHISNLKATFTGGADPVEISVPSAPVQANYRTNIVGNLLTDQVIFNIEIKPAYEGEENIHLENITSVVALNALFVNGGSAKLMADLDLAEPVTVPAGKEVVLDLNGHSISNSSDIWEVNGNPNNWSLFSVQGGKLTLTGEGKLQAKENDCYAIDVRDNGELVVEGGKYVGNIHAVYVHDGKATINGGEYSIQQTYPGSGKEYEFVLNCRDENYKAGNASIVVTGGKFDKFNPQNCKAEGEGTNFCAEGYKTIKVGNYYTVVTKDVTAIVSDQEGLEAAIAVDDSYILLAAGTYTIPATAADNVVIEGVEGTVIDCPAAVQYHGKSLVFKNIAFKYPNVNYNGIQHAKSIIYDNCVFEGRMTSYATTAVFENCTFNQTVYDYSIWTYGSEDITFNGCAFNCLGKAVKVYNEGANAQNATFNNCTFTVTELHEGANKAAITITSNLLKDGKKFYIFANGCTATGFPEEIEFGGTSLWDVEGTNAEVTVDGTKVFPTA